MEIFIKKIEIYVEDVTILIEKNITITMKKKYKLLTL